MFITIVAGKFEKGTRLEEARFIITNVFISSSVALSKKTVFE